MSLRPFRVRFRVRYAECDAQQVVFNARYGDYVDLAVTEYFRHLAGGIQALNQRGLDTRVVRLLTEWQNPAQFDDVLDISVQTRHLGNTAFTLALEIRNPVTRLSIAHSEIVYVLVDNQQWQKTPLPEDFRRQLQQGLPGKLVDFSAAPELPDQ